MYLEQPIKTAKNFLASMQVNQPTIEEERHADTKDLKHIRDFEKTLIRLGFQGERVIGGGLKAQYQNDKLSASLEFVRYPRFSGNRGGEATFDCQYIFTLEDTKQEKTLVSVSKFGQFPLEVLTNKIKKHN
jgi:hypothetical protein